MPSAIWTPQKQSSRNVTLVSESRRAQSNGGSNGGTVECPRPNITGLQSRIGGSCTDKARFRFTTMNAVHTASRITGRVGKVRATSEKPASTNMAIVPVKSADPLTR